MEALDLQQLEGLFFALLGLVVLIFAVLISYVIIANRRQRDRMTAAYEADKLAPRPALKVTGQIMSLVRSEVGGPLGVEIDGKQYASLADIEDPHLRRQVVGTALELIQFTGALGQADSPELIGEPGSWREDLRESSQEELERIHEGTSGNGSEPVTAPAPAEVEEQFLNLLSEMGQSPPTTPEKPSVASALRQRRLPKIPKEESSRSFVDEIEAIVQRRIHTAPVLHGRDLHVRLGGGDSVCFVFEGVEYEHLEEIPNLTAQQLVRDAISEWDERA